jgi:HD-GYP domain-containing protein (c-di-GMP phosphodiesterase class II)
MTEELRIPLFEMTMCLSNAMDLVSPHVVDHHKRVAHIATSIAAEIGLSASDQEDIMMAGIVHDIGAISLKDRLDGLHFELEHSDAHAELGYRLIRSFGTFASIAPLVRFHHVPWAHGKGADIGGTPVPLSAHILHLADRIAVLINQKREILGQVKGIVQIVKAGTDVLFVPELLDAFMTLAGRECFWFDAVSPSIGHILKERTKLPAVELDLEGLLGLTNVFSTIIDFRSRFTACHSSGVAAAAEGLARLIGLPSQDLLCLRVAGHLHDLGKLAVPSEILEKPGRLTREEQNVIRNHPYHTFRTLANVKGLGKIKVWASLHHECMNGNGYPFHVRAADIPLQARVMAVADVFTAITEDRPYRSGMPKGDARWTLRQMTAHGELDPDIVALLDLHYEKINDVRLAAQTSEYREYRRFGGEVFG